MENIDYDFFNDLVWTYRINSRDVLYDPLGTFSRALLSHMTTNHWGHLYDNTDFSMLKGQQEATANGDTAELGRIIEQEYLSAALHIFFTEILNEDGETEYEVREVKTFSQTRQEHLDRRHVA